MPNRSPRLASLIAGLVLVVGGILAPTAASAARPVQPAETWIVTLRAPEGRALPTRRGGLRATATAIARQRAAATARSIDALQARVGFTPSQRYTYAMNGFAARLTAVQLAALRADGRVIGLRRARPVEPAGQLTPAGILRIGTSPDTAPAASADVSVAIVDTGVGKWESGHWRHGTELNLVGGVNAFDPHGGECGERAPDPTQNPASFSDTNGHGTHVAGTIGAARNGTGVVGVAPGVRLYSVRVFQGVSGSDATVICGLDWIAAWNANHPSESADIDVVNMSLRGFAPANPHPGCGAPLNDDPEEAAVCAVVQTAKASVVVAAGNETDEVANYTPSRYDSVITVSALTDFDGAAGGLAAQPGWCAPPRGTEVDDTFSLYSNFGPEVDIAAPGTCVRSTALASADGVASMSGTSMATPHVTGAIARYLGLHPNADPDEVRARLLSSAALDWDAATDPDDQPDRLVDVAALVASDPDLALFAVPQEIGVPGGTTERNVKVRLQRIGGYAGPVTLSVVGALPAGVASATFGSGGTIAAGLDKLGTGLTITFDASPADGLVELTLRAAGDGGIADQLVLPIRFDSTPPVIGGAWPRIAFRPGSWLNSAPVRLSWTATDAQGALRSQELQRARKTGGFSPYSRPGPSAGSTDASMEKKVDTRWRIKATDLVGNSALSSELTTRMVPVQAQKAELTAGWSVVGQTTAAAEDLLVTTKAGRTATFTFTGRAVAVAAPLGQGKGRFKIRLDGQAVATVDLARTLPAARRLVWVSDALAPGSHTVRIVSLDGRVEIDAFLVLR